MNFTERKNIAIDGSKGMSRGITLAQYNVVELHTFIDNYMTDCRKSVVGTECVSESPSYRSDEKYAYYTSYYQYHTFTVMVSHTAVSTTDRSLSMFLSIRANGPEETDETRAEMAILDRHCFSPF